MASYIRVSNVDNNTVWEKGLTNEEFQTVKGYVKGKSTIAIIPAILKPVRTNNLENFSKDFFLPTVVNHAIKVQCTVGRVFAILAALILDVFTFPIRLITAIPRAISNAKEKENPLRKYLISESVDEQLLASDHVLVKLGWECTSQYPTSQWTTKEGTFHQQYDQEQHWSEQNVNFIELPIYKGWDHYARGMSG